jgi:hypothetical protein
MRPFSFRRVCVCVRDSPARAQIRTLDGVRRHSGSPNRAERNAAESARKAYVQGQTRCADPLRLMGFFATRIFDVCNAITNCSTDSAYGARHEELTEQDENAI